LAEFLKAVAPAAYERACLTRSLSARLASSSLPNASTPSASQEGTSTTTDAEPVPAQPSATSPPKQRCSSSVRRDREGYASKPTATEEAVSSTKADMDATVAPLPPPPPPPPLPLPTTSNSVLGSPAPILTSSSSMMSHAVASMLGLTVKNASFYDNVAQSLFSPLKELKLEETARLLSNFARPHALTATPAPLVLTLKNMFAAPTLPGPTTAPETARQQESL